MRHLSLLLALFFMAISSQAQTVSKPKLVVGIVVDQMRYDYLYRYQAHYGSGGFNRLLNGGFSCESTYFNFVPTYTGPGHAAIYTGTTPALNGIIGNDWWDESWGSKRYCTADPSVKLVGGNAQSAPAVGQQSPASLLSTTITDELRLSNNFRSKVASVCLKDRGSILPGGHIPNACYWFDDYSGNWVTSTYYPDSLGLPNWVRAHNAQRWPDTFLAKTWDRGHLTTQSFANWTYTGSYSSIRSGFPHPLAEIAKGNYGILRFTPYGNSLVTNFAMKTIEGMKLGADEWTDFLCVSYSSTDYCAHQFGIHAEETEDMYVRMDRELSTFFDYLDRKFGKDNVLVFLTADHGGSETPAHLNKLNIPAGVFEEHKLEGILEKTLASVFGVEGDYIKYVENQQIWLNWAALLDLDIKPEDVAQIVGERMRGMPGVYDVFTRQELELLPAEYPFVSELRRGIHPKRSGDILYVLDPAWHADGKLFKLGGATHGSPYPYDTHVPLLWYGWSIKPGRTYARINITDIAPTLAAKLRIMEPNGTTGKVIEDVMR